jgi:hypothetical protein
MIRRAHEITLDSRLLCRARIRRFKPWKMNMVWDLAPGEEIGEFACAENNTDPRHFAGK